LIAFDTNYVVRHLVQDDPDQCKIVAKALKYASQKEEAILIPDIVLCEVTWVLESCYRAKRPDLLMSLSALRNDPVFCFQNPSRLDKALECFAAGKADFSDYLIAETCREQGRELQTFDRKLG
jgi:predicted nucleic-acid-binding protein